MRLKKLNELYPLQLLDDLPKLRMRSTELLQQSSIVACEVEHYDKILKDFLVKGGGAVIWQADFANTTARFEVFMFLSS